MPQLAGFSEMVQAIFFSPWANELCLLSSTEHALLPLRPGPAPVPLEGPDSSGEPLGAGRTVLVWPSVERRQVEVARPRASS